MSEGQLCLPGIAVGFVPAAILRCVAVDQRRREGIRQRLRIRVVYPPDTEDWWCAFPTDHRAPPGTLFAVQKLVPVTSPTRRPYYRAIGQIQRLDPSDIEVVMGLIRDRRPQQPQMEARPCP